MLGLWRANHVDHAIDLESLDTIDDTRKVGGCVVVSAHRVLHDER